MDPFSIGGALLGGLFGGGGGSSQQQQTVNRDPWAAVQPWLKENIKTGQDLQAYYQQNPFNPQQQQAYQNIFSDLDSNRSSNAGLLDFANRMMNSGYQRPAQQGVGSVGRMGSRAPATNPAIFSQGNRQAQAGTQGGYGLLDYSKLSGPVPQAQPVATAAPVASAPPTLAELYAQHGFVFPTMDRG